MTRPAARSRSRTGTGPRAGGAAGKETDGTRTVQFGDNAALPQLFGEHDRHLVRIENELDVTITARGNRLAIAGEPDRILAAQQVLNTLYDRVRAGDVIESGAVDALVRLAARGALDTGGAGKRGGRETVVQTPKRRIAPRTPVQAEYLAAMDENELVFALGPAGTGKTYLAVARAIAMLRAGDVDRIILSRPAVEAGERLGFLPGDLREKVDPYLRPLYDALHDMMPGDQAMKRLESGEIEVAPLAFMRGRTLAHSFIILDEAQNTTSVQMKMCLTRLGEGSRMVVTGDMSQIDLPPGTRSGLADAVEALDGVEGVGFIHLTAADMVRHPLVTKVVRAYEAVERKRAAAQSRAKPARAARTPKSDDDGKGDGKIGRKR